MKKLLVLSILLLSSVFAQKETIFSGEIAHGGFGAPVVKFSSVKGEGAVFVGGKGGWVVNHSFVIGGAGYGLATKIEKNIGNIKNSRLHFGYGGLYLEYIHSYEKLIHFSAEVLVGAGGMEMSDDKRASLSMDDTFFVVEPALNLELNVHEMVVFGAGVSYRFVNGIETEGFSNKDFSNLSGQLYIKFGVF